MKEILKIIVGARRPLTLGEMALALGVAVSKNPTNLKGAGLDRTTLQQNIRQWCGLFVSINHSKLYLIHQTAKEFLLQSSEAVTSSFSWKNCVSAVDVETIMTSICIEFLSLEDVAKSGLDHFHRNEGRYPTTSEPKDDVGTFIEYSAEYWPIHLRESGFFADTAFVNKILQLYNFADAHFQLWFPIFWERLYWTNKPKPNATGLAALNGHGEVLKLLLHEERYGIDEQGEDGVTPLIWASEEGHEKVVEILVKKDADVNAQGGEYGNALQAASVGGHEKVVQMLLDARADVNAQGGRYGTALQAALYGGREKVVKVVQMLLNAGAEMQIPEEVVKAAAGNHGSGEEVMRLLLNQRGAEIQITEEVVKAAAGNYGSGKEVMRLLLELRGAEIQITEEVVKAAAGNHGSGEEVMRLLLKQRGAEIQITEEVVKAAAGNYGSGKEVMRLLLNQRGAEIQITEEVVKAAAGNNVSGKEVIRLLLELRGSEIQITEEVVKLLAGNFDSRIMKVLLEQRGSEIQITEEVVKAAAGNYGSGKEVIRLLLELRGAEIQITEEVVKAAAGNYGSGEEVMRLLLEQRGAEIQITEEMVKAAAGNYLSGKEVIDYCSIEQATRF